MCTFSSHSLYVASKTSLSTTSEALTHGASATIVIMPPENKTSADPKDHLLPRPSEAFGVGGPPVNKSSSGPVVGIIIILALLLLGGWYFWNESLKNPPADPLPLIPADDSVPQQQ